MYTWEHYIFVLVDLYNMTYPYLFHLANQVKYMFPLEESVVATFSTNKGIYDKVIQNIAKSSWLETVAPEPKPV